MLPARPHADWYRKAAKRKLAELRAARPDTTLSQAQLDVARAHGFRSWRTLIAAIGERQAVANTVWPDGRTPLHAAAAANDRALVEQLLAFGADPEQRYGEAGHTPISWAITFAKFDAAAALIEGGARTDLYCAAAMGDLDAVERFFTSDGALTPGAAHTCRVRFLSLTTPRALRPDPTSRDLVADAIYAAIRHGRTAVARALLHRPTPRPIDLRSHAFHGATLLHWAYYAGAAPIAAMLVDRGADPADRDDTFACTPRAFGICMPARLGELALVAARLDEDPSLARINEGRGTPLHEAARGGHEAIVRLLIARGADPQARDDRGRTPRELADRAAGPWVELLS